MIAFEGEDPRKTEPDEQMVAPEGPWRVWWQGSGPERGDHIMAESRGRIAYLPAAEGTYGLHAEAERIVYEHNCALARLMPNVK